MSERPKNFLEILHQTDDGDCVGLIACAGFDLGKWRHKKLAEHLVAWLPHFALKPDEIKKFGIHDAYEILRLAAARIFKAEAGKNRGEIGELLLHIICVTEFRASAFVSRVFYKMRSNDQITGFDSALVTVTEDEDIELWLGEAKFYTDTKQAITAALSSLKGHLDEGFLEETKILIGPKIEPSAPSYAKLQWLFDNGNKLDEIVSRIVVPVLIASDSNAARNYDGCDDSYREVVIEEFEYIQGRFMDSKLAQKLRIVAIYVPLASKQDLEEEFIKKIGAFA
jgi:hypothetical protein